MGILHSKYSHMYGRHMKPGWVPGTGTVTDSSVSDPYSFDPDPAFLAEYRSGSRVIWPKIGKNLQLKNNYIFFCSKIAIYSSLGVHKGSPSCRRSLQPSKENYLYFCGSFLPSWVRIRFTNPDTDPLTWLNQDPIRIRNTGFTARGTAIWRQTICGHPYTVTKRLLPRWT